MLEAVIDADAMLDRMVEASLAEFAPALRKEPEKPKPSAPPDEATLFVDGAVSFLESRSDRFQLLERLQARLPPRPGEAESAPEAGQPGAADQSE